MKNPLVERLEARRVVEVFQMGQLVAERIDQARVLEGLAGRHVVEADANRSVRVADPVATLDVRPLGLDNLIAKAEFGTNSVRVCAESLEQFAPGTTVHLEWEFSHPRPKRQAPPR